jgi:MerR family transcriptional regulator, light-induced transcriptional regulator
VVVAVTEPVMAVEVSLDTVSRFSLSIGDFVLRTGVTEPTLRVWERRYGFPQPERTVSGHRRYSEEQVDLVERVLAGREAGLSLRAAIDRAQTPPAPDSVSLYSMLRHLRPELEPRAVHKRTLIAFSHAIEDEALARADALVMFACFQREAFYRSAERRWRELSRSAVAAAVFADFAQAASPDDRPAEVPIARRQQVAREWAIVMYGGRSSISMVGREPATSNVDAVSSSRSFEMIWVVEPEAVRALGRACVALTAVSHPQLADSAMAALSVDALSLPAEQARLTAAVLNRTLSALS